MANFYYSNHPENLDDYQYYQYNYNQDPRYVPYDYTEYYGNAYQQVPTPSLVGYYYSNYNQSEPLTSKNGDYYDPLSTQYVVSYNSNTAEEATTDVVSEEYNPKPFHGGYDINEKYGESLPASEDICYPPSKIDPNLPSLKDFSYGSVPSAYVKEDKKDVVSEPVPKQATPTSIVIPVQNSPDLEEEEDEDDYDDEDEDEDDYEDEEEEDDENDLGAEVKNEEDHAKESSKKEVVSEPVPIPPVPFQPVPIQPVPIPPVPIQPVPIQPVPIQSTSTTMVIPVEVPTAFDQNEDEDEDEDEDLDIEAKKEEEQAKESSKNDPIALLDGAIHAKEDQNLEIEAKPKNRSIVAEVIQEEKGSNFEVEEEEEEEEIKGLMGVGDEGRKEEEYGKEIRRQIPSGYGLEAIDLCEGVFGGYFPCLWKRNQRVYNHQRDVNDNMNDYDYCWKESADYLFGNPNPYGGSMPEKGSYGDPVYNYQRYHPQQPLTEQVEYYGGDSSGLQSSSYYYVNNGEYQ